MTYKYLFLLGILALTMLTIFIQSYPLSLSTCKYLREIEPYEKFILKSWVYISWRYSGYCAHLWIILMMHDDTVYCMTYMCLLKFCSCSSFLRWKLSLTYILKEVLYKNTISCCAIEKRNSVATYCTVLFAFQPFLGSDKEIISLWSYVWWVILCIHCKM